MHSEQVNQRWLKKNEAEEFPEGAKEELDEKKAQALQSIQAYILSGNGPEQVRVVTDQSEESIVKELKGIFSVKTILVNHEKRLTVDTTCSNLAIKYNLIYISVYQLIKQ